MPADMDVVARIHPSMSSTILNTSSLEGLTVAASLEDRTMVTRTKDLTVAARLEDRTMVTTTKDLIVNEKSSARGGDLVAKIPLQFVRFCCWGHIWQETASLDAFQKKVPSHASKRCLV